jgi:formate hydrogenlyase subunit 3/multisubunit Na+/H+ antiporter MnhD subunit
VNPGVVLFPDANAAWLAVVLLPLGLAALLLSRRLAPLATALAPLGALPALLLALSPPARREVWLPDLLLGTLLGLDGIGQAFLFLTACLWLLAAIHARTYLAADPTRSRFFGFFLVCMAGNLGLVLAHDLVGFYFFFSLMTFAAYGLVIHVGNQQARRAARVYLIFAVVGEALLLPGLILAASAAGTADLSLVPRAVADDPRRDLIVFLLLTGFGIKAGVVPLHVWLPLAHPVAPTPASAVLSGAMIKAGLLGWLRVLPVGEEALPFWGTLLLALGLGAAFYAALIGVVQTRAKTVLAYSSISQMGIMAAALGTGLLAPAAWPLALNALQLHAVHHALIKGALFLGVSVVSAAALPGWPRLLIGAALALLALALAGAPFTSGMLTKALLKEAMGLLPSAGGALIPLLTLTGVATMLLMVRFLHLVWPHPDANAHAVSAGLWLPWAALIGLLLVVTPIWYLGDAAAAPGVEIWEGVWPLGAGIGLYWGAWQLARRWRVLNRAQIPEGDLLALSNWLAPGPGGVLRRAARRADAARRAVVARSGRLSGLHPYPALLLAWVESAIARWNAAGLVLLILLLTLLVFLIGL